MVFHAINRGNNRELVFVDHEDHFAFLQSLGRTQLRYPFRLYGYCLMSNHFHLLLRPAPGTTISRVLQSLTIAHTLRHHRRHRTVGHVWQGRFKSPVVQTDEHLWAVLPSIEANPLRAGMVADPAAYRWSSDPAHGEGRPDPLLEPLPSGPTWAPTSRRGVRPGDARSRACDPGRSWRRSDARSGAACPSARMPGRRKWRGDWAKAYSDGPEGVRRRRSYELTPDLCAGFVPIWTSAELTPDLDFELTPDLPDSGFGLRICLDLN